jgi:hypothetical protein
LRALLLLDERKQAKVAVRKREKPREEKMQDRKENKTTCVVSATLFRHQSSTF